MTSSDIVDLYEEMLGAATHKLQAAHDQNWDVFSHYDSIISEKIFIIQQAPLDLTFDTQQEMHKRNAIELIMSAEAKSMELAKARMSMLSAMIDTTANQRQILDGYGS